jgi:hypothetical protein
VFASLGTAPVRVERPASRSWLTSSGVASYRTALSGGEAWFRNPPRCPKARLPFRSQTGARRQAVRCSAALLGVPALASRFAFPPLRGETSSRVALEADTSSGASSRLVLVRADKPLPKELPSFPVPSPAGGDRTFGHLPHRHSVSGFLVRPGPPSRSPDDNAPVT